jgi:hypothetical protein
MARPVQKVPLPTRHVSVQFSGTMALFGMQEDGPCRRVAEIPIVPSEGGAYAPIARRPKQRQCQHEGAAAVYSRSLISPSGAALPPPAM